MRSRPANYRVGCGPDGLLMLVDTLVPSEREQFETKRLQAYADPIAGFDRFFSEVARLQI